MQKQISISLIFLILLGSSCTLKAQHEESSIEIGKVYSLESKVMGEGREYRVLLPKSYQNSNLSFPVIYVLDGDSYYLAAYSAMRALSGNGDMPESIIVAITTPEREKNMTPPYMDIYGVPSPNADEFLKHLSEELIPHINDTYRTLPLRILMGHSHGGIFNVYALTENPNAFKWHLMIDAPMHLDNNILEEKVDEFIRKNPQHRGRLATTWARFGWNEEKWAKLESSDNNITAMTFQTENETHSSMYFLAFYKGLKNLFFDYAYRHDATRNFKEIDDRFNKITADYGYEVKIPQVALGNGAIEHLAAANLEEARAFANRLKQDYQTQKVMREDVGVWLKQLETNPPKESRESYINRPDATVSQLKDFIGIWKDEGRYKFEIKNNGGKVEGLLTQYMPGGNSQFIRFKKIIRLSDGSIELSHENGMTPRSMLIAYKLTLVDSNTIKASNRLIVFWPNMGGRGLDESFTLKKQ